MEHKRFRTYTEQRELLESRGLIIPHPRFFTSDIRNTCAHGSRIYMPNKTYKFQRLIPDTKIHVELEIPRNPVRGRYLPSAEPPRGTD